MRWLLVLGAAVLCNAGCSSPKLVGNERLQVVGGTALPAPSVSDFAGAERPYHIGALDKVSVNVFGISELSTTVQVDASGQIALPAAGVIDASGKTPTELGSLIAQRLQDRYVKDPQVTVNVVETVSQAVTVDGEVAKPGRYPVLGKMTLMRAIASAQGTTEFARKSHVVVFRTVNNQQMAALYNLQAIRQGAYEDPEVYANDVVVVGEASAKRTFRDVMQAAGLVMTPIIALLQ